MKRESVQGLMEQLATGLNRGDARLVASFWGLPALLLADEGVRIVQDLREVEAFFQEAIAWYRAKGAPCVRPALKRVDTLSRCLVAVDVEWIALDAEGTEKAREQSHYILRLADLQLSIHVAMSRTLRPS